MSPSHMQLRHRFSSFKIDRSEEGEGTCKSEQLNSQDVFTPTIQNDATTSEMRLNGQKKSQFFSNQDLCSDSEEEEDVNVSP